MTDRQSFVAFVEALAVEREDAQQIEREHPTLYMLDGAHGWKNAEIGAYLFACLVGFDSELSNRLDMKPTWRAFAKFLYCGKVIE